MVALLPGWSLRGVVAALQALRGVASHADGGDRRFPASPTRARSWPGSAWCRASIHPAPQRYAARSPRPATAAPGGCWWRAPGPTGCRRASAANSSTQPCSARTDQGRGLEGAGPVVCPLPTTPARRQADECRHCRHRARTRRLRLGHRYHRHAAVRADGLTRCRRQQQAKETDPDHYQAAHRRARRPVRATLAVIPRPTGIRAI